MSDGVHLLVSEIYPPHRGGSGRWLSEIYSRFGGNRLVVTVDSEGLSGFEDPPYVRRVPFAIQDTSGLTPFGLFNYWRWLRSVRSVVTGRVASARAARVLPEGWLFWLWRTFAGGPPYECFAHGEEINLKDAHIGGVMSSRQHRIMARLVFQNATRVIANSNNTARMLEELWGIDSNRIVIAHPGVDTRQFSPEPSHADSRARLNWERRFVLLTVGRLQARKGQDRAIESLPRMLPQIPNLLYVIAGDGSDRARLEALVVKHGLEGHVEFRSRFPDDLLIEMYRACDVFLLANRAVGADVEGFGMVLLEAAACAKPTIAGRSGGTSEAIIDGETGLIVDGDCTESIANAVLRLARAPDTALAMGVAGLKRVREEYDWDVAAKRIPFNVESA